MLFQSNFTLQRVLFTCPRHLDVEKGIKSIPRDIAFLYVVNWQKVNFLLRSQFHFKYCRNSKLRNVSYAFDVFFFSMMRFMNRIFRLFFFSIKIFWGLNVANWNCLIDCQNWQGERDGRRGHWLNLRQWFRKKLWRRKKQNTKTFHSLPEKMEKRSGGKCVKNQSRLVTPNLRNSSQATML